MSNSISRWEVMITKLGIIVIFYSFKISLESEYKVLGTPRQTKIISLVTLSSVFQSCGILKALQFKAEVHIACGVAIRQR